MKLLILAQNPKTEYNVDHPLDNTSSGKKLDRWLALAGILRKEVVVDNVFYDVRSTGYKVSEIKNLAKSGALDFFIYNYKSIVTLGAVPYRAVSEALRSMPSAYHKTTGVFELPHPSGRNRTLNTMSEDEIVAKLQAAYDYLRIMNNKTSNFYSS